MTSEFPAPQQALGFLYQTLRYSLYVAVRSISTQCSGIAIEKFDDIEIINGDSVQESLQVKRVATNLTDRSTDLWRTIRLWCESYKSNHIKLPDTVLSLVTTATAPEGSIASLLRPEGRDPCEALRRLKGETVSRTQTLEKAFDAFNEISEPEQLMLVRCIQVLDQAPDIPVIASSIKKHFLGVDPANLDTVYEQLEAWWLNQVLEHLRGGSKSPIPLSSIFAKIAHINRSVSAPKLDDEFFVLQVPSDYDVEKRTFVRQLKLIDLASRLVSTAIHDYYRAGKLRNWLTEEFHLADLTTYDQKLKEQWEIIFFGMIDELGSVEVDETELIGLGKKIYNKIQQDINETIHPDFTGRYITRGSYQMLADKDGELEVGWHPDFKSRILTRKID